MPESREVEVCIRNVELTAASQIVKIVLETRDGNKQISLEYVLSADNIPAELAAKRRPFRFQTTAAILSAVGVEIEYVRITRVEEGVIQGWLGIRGAGVKKEVSVRPSEAVLLSASLGGGAILVDDALLSDHPG